MIPNQWTPKTVTTMLMQLFSFGAVLYLLLIKGTDTDSIIAVVAVLSSAAGGILGSSAKTDQIKESQGQLVSTLVELDATRSVLTNGQKVAVAMKVSPQLQLQPGVASPPHDDWGSPPPAQ